MISRILCIVTLWFAVSLAAYTHASDTLRFGFLGPLSGPNSFLGKEVSSGIELGFAAANEQKLLPYSLQLIKADDQFRPEKTAHLLSELVLHKRVVGFLGNVGTPSTLTILPSLKKYDVPVIAPIGATRILSSKIARPYIFSVRTDYEEEAFKLTQALVKDLDIEPKKISVLLQKDAFGEALLASILRALKHYGLKNPSQILQIRHIPNSEQIDDIAATFLMSKQNPDAIFLATTYQTGAAFIEKLGSLGISPVYATFSFTGLEPFQTASANTSATIITTQVTPPLSLQELLLAQEFFADREYFHETSKYTHLNFEGYLIAKYVAQYLKMHFPNTPPDQSELIEKLRNGKPFDLDFKQTLLFSDPILQYRSLLWQQIIYAGELLPYKASKQTRERVYKNQGGMLP